MIVKVPVWPTPRLDGKPPAPMKKSAGLLPVLVIPLGKVIVFGPMFEIAMVSGVDWVLTATWPKSRMPPTAWLSVIGVPDTPPSRTSMSGPGSSITKSSMHQPTFWMLPSVGPTPMRTCTTGLLAATAEMS